MTKRCISCCKNLPLSAFRNQSASAIAKHKPNSSPKSKLQPRCKLCERVYHKRNRKANPFIGRCNNASRDGTGRVPQKILKSKLGHPSKCYICGESINGWNETELDHLVPKSKGGKTVIDNLAWSHRTCNRIKHDLSITELLSLIQKILLNHKAEMRRIAMLRSIISRTVRFAASDSAGAAVAEPPKKAAAKKPAAKKGAKKAAPKKKAAKKAEPKEKGKNDLTKREKLVLTTLNRNPNGLTRGQIKEKSEIGGGLSRILGATTKDKLGVGGADSLEGRKFVKAESIEGQRGIVYTITASGKAALAAAKE